MGLLNLLWRLRGQACALQEYIARRSEFAAKRVFSSYDEIFMICALLCSDKSASKPDSLFMSNEERGGAPKKNAFFLRHNERDE